VLHPHGVDIANIASYLSGMLCNGAAPNNPDDLANILGKYTNLFKPDQAKWRFCGFSEPTESQSDSK